MDSHTGESTNSNWPMHATACDTVLQAAYCRLSDHIVTSTSNHHYQIGALGQEMRDKLGDIEARLHAVLAALHEIELEALILVQLQNAVKSSFDDHRSDLHTLLSVAKSQLDDRSFARLLNFAAEKKSLTMSLDLEETVPLSLLNYESSQSLSHLVVEQIGAIAAFHEPNRAWFSWHSDVSKEYWTSTANTIMCVEYPWTASSPTSDKVDSDVSFHGQSSTHEDIDNAILFAGSIFACSIPDPNGFEESNDCHFGDECDDDGNEGGGADQDDIDLTSPSSLERTAVETTERPNKQTRI